MTDEAKQFARGLRWLVASGFQAQAARVLREKADAGRDDLVEAARAAGFIIETEAKE